MPFDHPIPHSFTSTSIRNYAPPVPGLYGLSTAREWLYIGATDNIQGKLLEHLRDGTPSRMRTKPAGFVFEMCDSGGQNARCLRLVEEYAPVCNGS